MRSVLGDAVEAEVAVIGSLRLDALRRRWRALRGDDPPRALPIMLLRGRLAYAAQADRYGGLSSEAQGKLGRMAKRLEADSKSDILKGEAPPAGARLVRDWRGERHQVEILEKGFAYRGKAYASLSVIAREITGAHWSGPRFFGLKTRKTEERR